MQENTHRSQLVDRNDPSSSLEIWIVLLKSLNQACELLERMLVRENVQRFHLSYLTVLLKLWRKGRYKVQQSVHVSQREMHHLLRSL